MGRYYEKVKAYTRKVRRDDDDEEEEETFFERYC